MAGGLAHPLWQGASAANNLRYTIHRVVRPGVRIGRRAVFGNWDEVAQRRVTSRLLELPVAGGSVDCDEGGQDADEEEDQHHVLGKPNVLLMNTRGSAASKEIFVCVEIVPPVAPEASASAWLVQVHYMLLDHPTVNAQLMALPSDWSQTRTQFPGGVGARVVLPGHADLSQPAIFVSVASLPHFHWWPAFPLAAEVLPNSNETLLADALAHSQVRSWNLVIPRVVCMACMAAIERALSVLAEAFLVVHTLHHTF